MDARTRKMAEVLINYSIALQEGESILIRSLSPAGEPLAAALYQEALKVGGKAFTYVHISNEDALAIEATDDAELLAEANPMLMLMYEECDAVIRIEASENPVALGDYPLDLQKARQTAAYAPIGIQMRREGAGELRRTTTLFPTQGYAQASNMSLMQYQDFVYNACKLDLDDPVAAWNEMEKFHNRLIAFLDGKKHMHVRGDNIDLQMSIDGRTFINASGRSNFPDGEIFTGPVEDSVNGWVNFTYPAFYQGNKVIGAKLKFEDGLVVSATADENGDFLNKVLDTDEGSRRLGEFAIGTNKGIQRFSGQILFDEKIGGTVHMAVGQGYPKSGSTNTSGIHWDMIADMRDGGEILVDGELFYKDGDFVV